MARKPTRVALRLNLVAAALAATAGAAVGEEIAGVEFPETWNVSGRTLALNGTGIREYGVFGIDVYAAGLYLPAAMRDAMSVLNHRGAKVLHMHAFRDASAEDTAHAWAPYLRDNCRAKCVYPKKQARQFLRMLPETTAGETQTYIFTGDRVEMLRDGRSLGTIEGNGFARLLLATWFGNSPSSETLKQALLGRR